MSRGSTWGEEETKCLIIIVIIEPCVLHLFKLWMKATRWIDNTQTDQLQVKGDAANIGDGGRT